MLELNQIELLQKKYGYSNVQNRINTGSIWNFQGSVGRAAMGLLESGICFLPDESTQDYYGNYIPSRNELQAGTKGTLENSQKFWQKVIDGEIDLEVNEEF